MTSNFLAEIRGNRAVRITWAAAILLALVFLFRDVASAFHHGNLAVAPNTLLGRDFVNVFTGGRLELEGKLTTIYDLYAYNQYQDVLFDGAVQGHNYSYTPVSFLYIWIFGLFPYVVSYFLWLGLTGTAFLFAARPYVEEAGLPAWTILLLPAVAMNVWAGHYGLLFGALWLGAWRLLDTRPRMAGVLVGLLIVKPHLAILMPLVLIRRRAWTSFLFAGLTVFGAIALSALLFGWTPWLDYVGTTLGYQAAMVDDVGTLFLLMMPTVAPSLFLLGIPPAMAWAVQITIAVAACTALWVRMPDDPQRAGLAVGCATFLVLPYAFIYDLTVLGIAALLILHRAERLQERPALFFLAALGFLLPVITIALNAASFPVAPVMIAFLLAILLSRHAITAEHVPDEPRLAPASLQLD